MPRSAEYAYLYGRRWKTAAHAYLREHPLCSYCHEIGRLTEASVVDHIKPHNGDVGLFWHQDNWQSLCKPCHDRVKALEESRGHRVGSTVEGIPIDPRHHWNR
jgi:5-methylcytosine-specific restriction protein A